MKQKEIKILSDDELNDKLSLFSSSLYETKTTHAYCHSSVRSSKHSCFKRTRNVIFPAHK